MKHTTAKPVRVSGWKARAYVQNGINFTNHNGQLYGRWESPSLYVVYSYGAHWPLFVWYGGTWYGNEDSYSPTTTKHRTQTHPLTDVCWMPQDDMRALAGYGWTGLCEHLAATRLRAV
jgi:hypothetical protein